MIPQRLFHHTPRVALLIETSTSFGRRLLHGISHYVNENGPWITWLEQRSIYDPIPEWLLKWKGDGILYRSVHPNIIQQILDLNIPTIDMNEQVRGIGLPLVFNDHQKIGQMAAEHFLEIGLESFGYVGHPGIYWSDERLIGFRETLEKRGFVCDEFSPNQRTRKRYQHSSWDRELESLAQWLSSLHRPAACFACNDYRAMQVMHACRHADIPIPEQIAVLGVDNEDVVCDLCTPRLSSIVPAAERFGFTAAAMLDQLMNGKKIAQENIYIPPERLIIRQSTDIMAVRDPLVSQVLMIIRQHALEGLTVEDIVRMLDISRSTLQRRVQASLRTTILQLITQAKINHAKYLLKTTTLNRARIAEACGFPNEEYLSVAFRRHMGMTMRDYRNTQ